MSTELAFLRAIGERPDDDVPRLIYADWLEDQGDPRAELIRIQCQIAATRYPARELLDRECELFRQHGRQWRDLYEPYGVLWCEYTRGIPERVSIRADHWIDPASPIRELLPALRSLELLQPGWRDRRSFRFSLRAALEACTSPVLRRIGSFDITLDREQLQDAASSSRFASIESLVLGRLVHPRECLSLLCEPAFDDSLFRSITELAVIDCGLRAEDLQALSPPHATCGHLRRLWLDKNPIGEDGLCRLLTSPTMFGLRQLSVTGCGIQLGRQWQTVNALPMPHLHDVNLSFNRLTGLRRVNLGASSGFMRVKHLGLSNCRLGPDDVAFLSSLRVVSGLNLSGNPLGDAGIAQLAGNPSFRMMRELELRTIGAGDVAAEHLIASSSLKDVQHLDLSFNRFSPPVQRALHQHFGPALTLTPSRDPLSAARKTDDVLGRR